MSDLSIEEFRTLRAAIGARGQLRAGLALAGLAAWAAILVATLVLLPYPVAAAIPLLVLVATLEVIRPLHAGAERIGRYLQVFYETRAQADGDATPAWEHTAMAFGPSVPGAAGHPLFLPLFALATIVNLLAVVLPAPVPVEWTVMTVPHAAFLVWLLRVDRVMRTQRVRELARFRALSNHEGAKDTKRDTKDS